ncbi:MAG: hypothetical protein ACT4PT_06875 [Methanobacteriota archaeon]
MEEAVARRRPVASQEERTRPVAAALKARAYDHALRTLSKGDLGSAEWPARASGRTLFAELVPTGRDANGASELFGLSPPRLVEALDALSGAGAARRSRRLFGAATYALAERLAWPSMASFVRTRNVTGPDWTLSLELRRIGPAFGEAWFPTASFIALCDEVARRVLPHKGPSGDLTARTLASPIRARFLEARLTVLAGLGALTRAGPEWRLTPAGNEAAIHANLFFDGVSYAPGPEVAAALPTGLTLAALQQGLEALNRRT